MAHELTNSTSKQCDTSTRLTESLAISTRRALPRLSTHRSSAIGWSNSLCATDHFLRRLERSSRGGAVLRNVPSPVEEQSFWKPSESLTSGWELGSLISQAASEYREAALTPRPSNRP